MSTVRLIWKCTPPKNKKVVELCERLMTLAAQEHGMDTAVIREEPHTTTRFHGRRIQTVPHITGDIVASKTNKGYALHWNLDQTHTTALPSQPPNAPNPVMWELKYKEGTGFVLTDETGEHVHDV